MPSDGEAASERLSASDPTGTSTSANVLQTRGAQVWARPWIIACIG